MSATLIPRGGRPSLRWPGVRSTDPDASRVAASQRRRRVDLEIHAAVLRLLADAGAAGATDFELADRTGRQQTSIGKRRGELRDSGQVEPLRDADGNVVHRPSPSGKPATVWTLAGRS